MAEIEDNTDKVLQAHEIGRLRGVEALLVFVEGRMVMNVSVDKGDLRSSICHASHLTKTGDLSLEPGIDGIVGTNKNHAIYVEKGTGQHLTSVGHEDFIKNITEWGLKHGFTDASSIMGLIRHIRKHGTKAHPFARPAIDEGQQVADAIFKSEMDKAMAGL